MANLKFEKAISALLVIDPNCVSTIATTNEVVEALSSPFALGTSA